MVFTLTLFISISMNSPIDTSWNVTNNSGFTTFLPSGGSTRSTAKNGHVGSCRAKKGCKVLAGTWQGPGSGLRLETNSWTNSWPLKKRGQDSPLLNHNLSGFTVFLRGSYAPWGKLEPGNSHGFGFGALRMFRFPPLHLMRIFHQK